MYKMQVGQLLAKNELSMEEFLIWYGKYGIMKFYKKDGMPNYLRADVERWLRQKCGDDCIVE